MLCFKRCFQRVENNVFFSMRCFQYEQQMVSHVLKDDRRPRQQMRNSDVQVRTESRHPTMSAYYSYCLITIKRL